MLLTRIGDVTLVWGESLRWDDRRRRLYFVDCATHRLYWLDNAITADHALDHGPRGFAATKARYVDASRESAQCLVYGPVQALLLDLYVQRHLARRQLCGGDLHESDFTAC